MLKRVLLLLLSSLACGITTADARAAGSPAPDERSDAVNTSGAGWAVSGHDFADRRFSPLKAINTAYVSQLGLAWVYDLDTHRGQEATPVEVDGVLYTSSAWSKVQTFRASTGELLWQYDPKVPGAIAIKTCCDVVNRGVAVSNGRVYVGALDGRLIALCATDGRAKAWVDSKAH